MDRIVVAVFGSEDQASAAASAIQDSYASGELLIYALALIVKDLEKASVLDLMIKDRDDAVLGATTRSLAQLLAELYGRFDHETSAILTEATIELAKIGIDATFLAEVRRHLLPGKTAIVTEIEEENTAAMDSLLEAQGGIVFRCARREIMHFLICEELDALRNQIQVLQQRALHESADSQARLKAELNLATASFQAKKNYARSYAAAVKWEAEAKIVSLQERAAKADGEVKARLERLADEVRANYVSRARELNSAWQLAADVIGVCLLCLTLDGVVG